MLVIRPVVLPSRPLGERVALFSVFFCWLLLAAPTAFACDFEHAPSSRWSLATEAGVSWLKTPCGDRFYSLGVNILDGGYPERVKDEKVWYSWKAFAPDLAHWVDETRGRLAAWGFNTAGGWSLSPQSQKLPAVIDLELGRHAKFHWFDPFAPDMGARMAAVARELVAPYRGSPYRIGYFSDNEVGWWAGALFVYYSKQPATSYTKRRWVALLRQHYQDDWAAFAGDFAPPPGVYSWPALLAATDITHMRPGGQNRRSARPTRKRCISAIACRFITIRQPSGRWRRMSMQSQ